MLASAPRARYFSRMAPCTSNAPALLTTGGLRIPTSRLPTVVAIAPSVTPFEATGRTLTVMASAADTVDAESETRSAGLLEIGAGAGAAGASRVVARSPMTAPVSTPGRTDRGAQ